MAERKRKKKSGLTQKDISQIKTGIDKAEEKIEVAHSQVNIEVDPTKLATTLVHIENQRIEVVKLIWDVVKNLVEKIGDQAKVGNQDIAKLAIVAGILADKGQLMQGGATSRMEFVPPGKHVGLKERMGVYKQLEEIKKIGRPKGGEKPT